MTKKDFFILLIKIFGLFSVIANVFSVLPSSISFALMDLDAFALFWIILVVVVVIGLFVVLTLHADKVVSTLNLEKGFEEERIDFGNIKPADIIKIGTFVVGGLLILNTLPSFLNHTLLAFKGEVVGATYHTHDAFDWLTSAVNFIIGYLLITNLDFVAKVFTKEKASKKE